MKNKIALFFLVISLSTTVDPILARNDIPSKNDNNKNKICPGDGFHKPSKQNETETEPKKGESYIPALIIFGPLLVKIIFGK